MATSTVSLRGERRRFSKQNVSSSGDQSAAHPSKLKTSSLRKCARWAPQPVRHTISPFVIGGTSAEKHAEKPLNPRQHPLITTRCRRGAATSTASILSPPRTGTAGNSQQTWPRRPVRRGNISPTIFASFACRVTALPVRWGWASPARPTVTSSLKNQPRRHLDRKNPEHNPPAYSASAASGGATRQESRSSTVR